jgi:aryl-alcohol dehydrogenase-like predicted oxidoreductase
VTSVLFGATSAQQVQANCAAVSLAGRLGPADLAHLHRIGLDGWMEHARFRDHAISGPAVAARCS